MRSLTTLALVFLALMFLGAAGCNKTGGGSAASPSSALQQEPASAASSPTSDSQQISASGTNNSGILTAPVPQIKGPKRTVAVGRFTSTGAFDSKYGSWDLGGGMSAMLASALEQSDRFIVLERANIGQVLSEQELKATGVTNPETGPDLGRLSGAQFLIYGAITEFGTEDKGGGASVGFSGGFSKLFSGGLGGQSTSGAVAMDIRVVDASTSQIIETHTVREDLSSSGVNLSLGVDNVSFGSDYFWKTPLGEATRSCINQAVRLIALDAQLVPWMGRVVEVDGPDVFVNVGKRAGVQTGDAFEIKRIVKTFTDPETGEVIGTRRSLLGTVQLQEIMEKMSIGNFTPVQGAIPQRGDLVVEVK